MTTYIEYYIIVVFPFLGFLVFHETNEHVIGGDTPFLLISFTDFDCNLKLTKPRTEKYLYYFKTLTTS